MYEQEQGLGEDYFFEGGLQEPGVYALGELYPRPEPNERDLIASVKGTAHFDRC